MRCGMVNVVSGGVRARVRCDLLGEGAFTDMQGGLFRPWLGPAYRATQAQLGDWMAEAGMGWRIDAAGNIVGRYEGTQPDAPALMIGSHIDSVHDGGRYDGMLGVVLGIEVVAQFHARGVRFPFAIEVVGFGDEEGSRFPVSMLTSQAVAGRAVVPDPALRDRTGLSVADAMAACGLDVARLCDAARAPGTVVAYLEAHIEQGPVLEAEDHALGVVSGIVAQKRFEIVIEGVAGHAGTMAMALRHDALAAAAEVILAVEHVARAGTGDLVATVGRMEVLPGATNVVPGRVVMSLDVRAALAQMRDDAADAIGRAVAGIARQRGVAARVTEMQALEASPCDAVLTHALAEAVEAVTGLPARRLSSGAGHDAMVLADLAPTAMLFLRCRGGVSHNPAEAVRDDDVEAALAAMVAFVGAMPYPPESDAAARREGRPA